MNEQTTQQLKAIFNLKNDPAIVFIEYLKTENGRELLENYYLSQTDIEIDVLKMFETLRKEIA
jgi:hypothetical protein